MTPNTFSLILGIGLGSYLWKWSKEYASKGVILYSVYYFLTNTHKKYEGNVDAPAVYDMYHEVFGGKATYDTYLRAIDSHFDKVQKTYKNGSIKIAKYYAFKQIIAAIKGAVIIMILSWSFSTPAFFFIGVLMYFVVRFLKYLIIDDDGLKNYVILHLTVVETIDAYKKSIKKQKTKPYQR